MTLDAAAAIAGVDDTIVAEATMPGRAALAVIRVSGPGCHAICRRVVHSWPTAPRVATLSRLYNADSTQLDVGIVVRYDGPASFTGEDAVEITTHGGVTVPATVLAALIEAGARVAQPGRVHPSRRAQWKAGRASGRGDRRSGRVEVPSRATAGTRAARRRALSPIDRAQRRVGRRRSVDRLRHRLS